MKSNVIKPNEPFDEEKEKIDYEKYKMSESSLLFKNENIPLEYKKDIKKISDVTGLNK